MIREIHQSALDLCNPKDPHQEDLDRRAYSKHLHRIRNLPRLAKWRARNAFRKSLTGMHADGQALLETRRLVGWLITGQVPRDKGGLIVGRLAQSAAAADRPARVGEEIARFLIELIGQTEFDITAESARKVWNRLDPAQRDLLTGQIRDATKVLFDARPNWAKHTISPRPTKTD